MTVITMSRTEIDRMGVLQDLAAGRIKVTAAATLMGLGRRQIYRLAKSHKRHGAEALVSRRRAVRATAPIPRICVIRRLESSGSVTTISDRRWPLRSLRSFMASAWRARRCGNG